jgi:hypothetical protein
MRQVLLSNLPGRPQARGINNQVPVFRLINSATVADNKDINRVYSSMVVASTGVYLATGIVKLIFDIN